MAVNRARVQARLRAVSTLCMVALLLTWLHDGGAYPASCVILILMLVTCAGGLWFQQRWVPAVAVLGFLAGTAVGLLELGLGNSTPWMYCVLAGGVCSVVGLWSHYRWQMRRMRVPIVELEPEEDSPEQWHADAEIPEDRRSIVWLPDLRPRSRTSFLYALSSLFFGLALFLSYQEDGFDLGWLFVLPNFILAIGLWFHQNWIRWFGALVCLGWVALVIWTLIFPNFNPGSFLNLLVVILLTLAWKFWNWTWETAE